MLAQFTIHGRVTKDPKEITYGKKGDTFVSLPVAVNYGPEKVSYFSISIFKDKLKEVTIKHLKKGAGVGIIGTMTVDADNDYKTNFTAQEITFFTKAGTEE